MAAEPGARPDGAPQRTRARTVGRGPKVRRAVLDAALAELAERGYAALSIERVALRAGVHKTTVYRRWPDRAALVTDAVSEQVAAEIPIPDAGTLAADLHALARGLAAWLNGPAGQRVLAVFFSDAARVPEVAAIRRQVFQDRVRRARPVLLRAIERGEIPAGTDPGEIITTLAAPLYFRALVTAEPVRDADADRAAALALLAARHGPPGP